MIKKSGTVLNSLEDWERLAGPKSPKHWKDYRSAKECARAWLAEPAQPGIPEELIAALMAHEDFGEILEWEGEPECLVRFDEYGGPANIDLLLSARDDKGPFVVAVEAKADETFGPLVSRALSASLERRLSIPSSKGLDRVEALVTAILGPRRKGTPPLHRVRYQLLTASAAALARAKADGATRAVVMIHEFITPATEAAKRRENQRDLEYFLKRIGGAEPERILGGELVGPVHVPGGARFPDPPPLYFGKASRRVLQREAAEE